MGNREPIRGRDRDEDGVRGNRGDERAFEGALKRTIRGAMGQTKEPKLMTDEFTGC